MGFSSSVSSLNHRLNKWVLTSALKSLNNKFFTVCVITKLFFTNFYKAFFRAKSVKAAGREI